MIAVCPASSSPMSVASLTVTVLAKSKRCSRASIHRQRRKSSPRPDWMLYGADTSVLFSPKAASYIGKKMFPMFAFTGIDLCCLAQSLNW